jgi:DNA-binding IclR family transcriptional regulator
VAVEDRQRLYADPAFGATLPPLARSIKQLEQDLAHVEASGFAETYETFQVGSGSIAAAIGAPSDRPVAAISVVGTRDELQGPRNEMLVSLVQDTAADISYLLTRPGRT